MDNTNWNEHKQQFSNICLMVGVFASEPVKSFKSKQGEQFYDIILEVLRTSHAIDRVPVTFSVAYLEEVRKLLKDTTSVAVTGELRTKFVPDGKNPDGTNHMKLVMSIFTRDICMMGGKEDFNDCHFVGALGKVKPVRITSAGRTVNDFTLKVKTKYNYNKQYCIPCISWGHMADWIATLQPGTNVAVDGRLQSRDYTDKSGNTHTVNELSVYNLAVIEENTEE